MHTKPVSMSRQELYEKVWSTPIAQLAQTYGISGVGLAKVCRKWKVPVPGRGYWQRLKSGKRVHQDRLPGWSHPWIRGPVEFQSMVRTVEEAEKDDETAKLIESEREPADQIVVADSLGEVHPLVSQTRDVLTAAKSNERGILQAGKKTCLHLQVSMEGLRRALLVMDALIKGLERRGYAVSVVEERAETRLTVLGETVEVGIEERVDRREKKNQSQYTYPPYEFVPSGVLSLRRDTVNPGG